MKYGSMEEQFQRMYDQEWVTWMMFVVIGFCVINILYSFTGRKDEIKDQNYPNNYYSNFITMSFLWLTYKGIDIGRRANQHE